MALANMVKNIRDAVETPLNQPLDAAHLFLIVGVIIIAWGFWIMVLDHLNEALHVE